VTPKVTRFKGLGEIFSQRIRPVHRRRHTAGGGQREIHQNIPETLEFYMGKNTPQRKDFIMENLI